MSSTPAFAQTAPSSAPSSAPTPFARIIQLAHERLEIGRKVALTKWDSGMPVADPPNDPRELQVIAAAAEEAKQRGVPVDLASAFFADQIEANKLVQFELLASWRRAGQPPAEPRADLKTELRPALDRLRPLFIGELLALAGPLKDPQCKAQAALAIAGYAQARSLAPLYAIALGRGLARLCGDGNP